MKAIVVADEVAGTAGMTLTERPRPEATINDVVIEVHASGCTPGKLTWPGSWTERHARRRRRLQPDRTGKGKTVIRVRQFGGVDA